MVYGITAAVQESIDFSAIRGNSAKKPRERHNGREICLLCVERKARQQDLESGSEDMGTSRGPPEVVSELSVIMNLYGKEKETKLYQSYAV